MFIYKFMAGIVEQMTAGDQLVIREEEEPYEPHKHRKVEKPTSYSQTMIHLLKGCIGAGVLAMSDAVRRIGIIASIFGIILVGFFATYCIQVLIATQYELCKRWRRGYMTYPRSMSLALQDGPRYMRWAAKFAYYFVDMVLVLWQLGICNIYCVFVGENIQQVCDFYGLKYSLRLHIIVLIIPLVISCLIKDLRLLTPFSTISNGLTLLGLVLVFFYLIEDDVTFEHEKMRVKGLSEIPIFIGTALFALEAVGVVLALEYNMKDPRQFVGLFGLFNIGMVIIISLYMLLGVFGYLKYGDDIKAVLTLNLPPGQKKAQAAKLLFAMAIFLSFPLQNFVAYEIIWRKLKKLIGEGKKRRLLDYMLRVVLVVIPWSLAVAIPRLGPFISFFGAFCLSLLAMVFPGIMDLCIWFPDKYGLCHYRLLRDILIIFIGLACLISGCYTSILEVTATSKQD